MANQIIFNKNLLSLSWLPSTEMEKISLLKKQFCQIKIPAFLHIDLYQLIATIKQTESDHQPGKNIHKQLKVSQTQTQTINKIIIHTRSSKIQISQRIFDKFCVNIILSWKFYKLVKCTDPSNFFLLHLCTPLAGLSGSQC